MLQKQRVVGWLGDETVYEPNQEGTLRVPRDEKQLAFVNHACGLGMSFEFSAVVCADDTVWTQLGPLLATHMKDHKWTFLTEEPRNREEYEAHELITALLCSYNQNSRGQSLVRPYKNCMLDLTYGDVEKGTRYSRITRQDDAAERRLLFLSEYRLGTICFTSLIVSNIVPTVSKLATPLPDERGVRRGQHLCSALHVMNGFLTERLDEQEVTIECYDECEVCVVAIFGSSSAEVGLQALVDGDPPLESRTEDLETFTEDMFEGNVCPLCTLLML